jgi:hypothetical protein
MSAYSMKLFMKYLISLLFLLYQTSLFTQIVTVSEPMTLRNDASYDLLGNIKGNILLFRDQLTEFKVQCFNEDLKQIWEKEIELDKKRPQITGILPSKNDFSVLYQYKIKGNSMLKCHKYDAGANLVDSVLVKNYGDLFYTPNLEIIRSDDRSKILAHYFERPNEFHVLVFDVEKMEFLWEKDFLLDDLNYDEDFQQILVGNDGTMQLIIEKNNRKIKQEEHIFEIFSYGIETDFSTVRYTVEMKDHLTYDVYFAYDNLNKHLVAGGLYSLEHRGRAEGSYYLNVDPKDPSNLTLTFHPFGNEFVATLLEKSKNKNKGIPEVSVQEVVLRRDGGILLIGELNKISERTNAGPSSYYGRGSTNIRDYYYDDLFVISIHPNGNIHWTNVMHKKQFSQDDGAIYSSYFLAKTSSALRVIFNDEIKYENTVSEYVIKGNGEHDRNSVMSTENQQLRLRFRDSIQTGSDEIIIPSERRNRLKLVKVIFNRRT